MDTDDADPRRTIFVLDELTTSLIGAGEVVANPSCAVKELIENSLDASATSIAITVRDGGLRLLQITDNGTGIYKGDLPLLCMRHATSKLRSNDDFSSLETFGFRGEALSSLSAISRFSILTKTEEDPVAWRAEYAGSHLKGDPKPCAGVVGTTITLENLFHNMLTRQKSIRGSDYYRQVVDVIVRYSLRYPHVAFSCRRLDDPTGSRVVAVSDVNTHPGASIADNIRSGFGRRIVDELFFFEIPVPRAKVTVKGCATGANVTLRKQIFILFVNGRLVDCNPLKRAISDIYRGYLKGEGRPFSFLNVQMDLKDVDVNVHPQKKEVVFSHVDIIEDAITNELFERLRKEETSRKMSAQTVLKTSGPRLTAEYVPDSDDSRGAIGETGLPTGPKLRLKDPQAEFGILGELARQREKRRKKKMKRESEGDMGMRDDDEDDEFFSSEEEEGERERMHLMDDEVDIDAKWGTLPDIPEIYGNKESARSSGSSGQKRPPSDKKTVYAKDKVRVSSDAPVGLFDVYLAPEEERSAALQLHAFRKRRETAMPMLTSISDMLNEARTNSHSGLTRILKHHFFVGAINSSFAALQYESTLLVAEIDPLVTEILYQQILTRFADFEPIVLRFPAPVMELLDCHIEHVGSGADMQIDAESCTTILLENAAMLSEYFGIYFKGEKAADALIVQLPLLLPGIMPNTKCAGEFLYDIAANTDWAEEWSCLKFISLRIAEWYGQHWMPLPQEGDGPESDKEDVPSEENPSNEHVDAACAEPKDELNSEKSRREWVLRHILFASLRRDFYPPRRFFTNGVLREVISSGGLYRVFERC